jgi:hypothetical protein
MRCVGCVRESRRLPKRRYDGRPSAGLRREAAERAARLGRVGGEGMVPGADTSSGVRHFIEASGDTIITNLPDILDVFLPPIFLPVPTSYESA